MAGLTGPTCPDDAVCRSVCLGPLGDWEHRMQEDLQRWGEHLESCVSCQERMERMFQEFCDGDPILRILPRMQAGRRLGPV